MYVHNILEELDDKNEYFLDSTSRTLYYMPNITQPKQFIAPQLPCIISIHGTQEYPAQDITIQGITFSHTANHFLRDYEAPSGGDYSVHRGGAIFIQGTHRVNISLNSFYHLGGNAIFISNYNVNSSILWNSFRYLGESAIVLVGSTDGIDGVSNIKQPNHTHIEGNIARDFSIYVKQGDAIMDALSRNSIWAGNLAFNAPRSIMNRNDGFGGGLEAYQNLLFNSNRETGDHGPINSVR